MTPHQIRLVQESFAEVEPIAATAASIFYARLFEIAPEVEPLFSGDMEAQGHSLMTTLAVVVKGLDDLDSLLPVAANLADRHVGYGVVPEHYPIVGAALLDTLATGLGDAFDAETKEAWATAYGTLSGAMVSHAYPEAA